MSDLNVALLGTLIERFYYDEGEGLAGARLYRCLVCKKGWAVGGNFPSGPVHDVRCPVADLEAFAALPPAPPQDIEQFVSALIANIPPDRKAFGEGAWVCTVGELKRLAASPPAQEQEPARCFCGRLLPPAHGWHAEKEKCSCGADDPQSARYQHSHLPWCVMALPAPPLADKDSSR